MNETNAEPYPGQFRIVWNSEKAEYRVSIPDYNGGEVVPLETVKSLEAHQSTRIAELERRVEESRAEVERLTKERDAVSAWSGEVREQNVKMAEMVATLQRERDEARAERDRLRNENEEMGNELESRAKAIANLSEACQRWQDRMEKTCDDSQRLLNMTHMFQEASRQLAEREEDRALLDPHARDILTIIAQDVECYCCTDGVPTKQPCGSCLAKAAIRAARAQPEAGSRIVFLTTLEEGPTDEHPGRLYARKGDGGWIEKVGGCSEGYWVKWDGWPSAAFGAKLGTDFKLAQPEDGK